MVFQKSRFKKSPALIAGMVIAVILIAAVTPGKTYLLAEAANKSDFVTLADENTAYKISSEVYTANGGFLSNIHSDTDIAALKSNIIGGANIYVYDESGAAVTDGIIKTGMTIAAINDDIQTDSLIAVVDGDITCDGYCDVKDLVRLKKSIAKMVVLPAAQRFAAAGEEKQNLTAADLTRIRKMLLEAETNQDKPPHSNPENPYDKDGDGFVDGWY